MNNIRTILRHNFSLEKKYIIWYALIFVISQIGFIQIPRFLGDMVNIIETKGSYNELRVLFWTACWFVFVFDSLDNIVGAIRVKVYELLLIKKRIIYREQIERKDYSLITDIWSGKLMQKFNQWITAEVDIFHSVLRICIITTVRGLRVLWIFWIYAPVMLFPLLIGAITAIVVWVYFWKKTDTTTQITDDIAEDNSKYNVRFFQEFGLIKINNKFAYENTLLHNLLAQLPKLELKKYIYGEIPYKLMYYLIQVGEFFLYLYLGNMVIWGTYAFGDLVMLAAYIRMLWRPIDSFMQNYNQIQRNISKYISLQEFLATPNTITDGDAAYIYETWAITLANVTFWYTPEKIILQNFTHHFLPGKTTALVGHSGSGKSTIIKLILKLYSVQQWTIYVDNQDINSLHIPTLYDHIGYLTQEPWIFDGTIRENLLYAIVWPVPEDSETQIRKALEMAQIDELVRWLPLWLDTELGEKWIKLSWGERQRLAMARVFLKNPEILIFDEPTSALDSIAEHAITDIMKSLFANRTVVVIAHRLQTVMHADEIIVLDHGRIAESGTHATLIAQWWIYAHLVDLQRGVVRE